MKRIIALTLLLLLLLQPAAYASVLKNHPKLILSDYTISPSPAKASEEFTLTLQLLNTNSDYTSRNVKATLLNESAQGGFGVFTPVGSSNTFYIEIIDPEEVVEQTLRFAVSSGAESKNHVLTLLLEYEDYQGRPYESRELIGIPVAQIARIDADEAQLPNSIALDGSAHLSVGFYNTGKDHLANVLVEVIGDFESEPARYFVGNFASGSSDVFSTVITPTKEGALEGELKISFEDSTGVPMELSKPFSTEVTPPEDTQEQEQPGIGATLPSPINLLIIGGVIVLLIALLLNMRQKKRRQREREELRIDE